MSLLSGLEKHDKNPGDYWGSSSSPCVNKSPDRSGDTPENDVVYLISTPDSRRAQPKRSCSERNTRKSIEEIEIEDDKKPDVLRSNKDKSPKDYHVAGNNFTIPKLKTSSSNSNTVTLGTKNGVRLFPVEDHAKELCNARPRNTKKISPKSSPLSIKRNWRHASSPVRSSPRNYLPGAVSKSNCQEVTSDNDLQVLPGNASTTGSYSQKSNKTVDMNDAHSNNRLTCNISLKNCQDILETEDDGFVERSKPVETPRPSSKSVGQEDMFCYQCNGPISNSGCLKCVKNPNKQPVQASISVDSFYQSKSGAGNMYSIAYSAERKNSTTTKRIILSRSTAEFAKNQPRIDNTVNVQNGKSTNNRTGTKRKSMAATKPPELVHISSDEDDNNEQAYSDAETMQQEEETTEEQGFVENGVENQVMDKTTQEHGDDEEHEAASEEEYSIPKEVEDLYMVRNKDRDRYISMIKDKDPSMVRYKDISMVRDKDISMAKNKDISMARKKDISMVRDKDISVARNKEISVAKNKEISVAKNKEISVARNKDISVARNKEISTAKNKDISMAKNQDISVARNTDETRTPSKGNELQSYQRDSIETLLYAQHIYVGKLHGKPTEPVKVTAEKIHISIVNGKTDYNFIMEGRDLASFMINNESEPLMVMIEPTQRWAQKIIKKYEQLRTIIDPGRSKRQIVLLLCEKLAKGNLADLMELVVERLSQSSVWKTMTPESAKTEFKRLPPPSDDHSEAESSSSEKQSTVFGSLLSTSISSLVTHRKSYNTRSKDVTIRDPKIPPEKVLVYPPSCKHGAITITTEDVQCLHPDTYLNDVIIDFFLKYLFEEVLSVSDKKRTHIFSSFFYKRLTQKNRRNSDQESRTAEYMHRLVKTWTKNVDIFTKDFLIFPINESSHWYLTVICYPGLVVEGGDGNSEEDEEGFSSGLEMLQKTYADSPGEDTCTPDNSNMSDDAFEMPRSKKIKRMKTTRNKVPVTRPCILIFDSLGGSHRSTVLINLRNYLSCEWKERKENNKPLTFNKFNLKGCYPKVPGQHNFSDCGVYVLQYVQSFFENPITDYRPPIAIPDWFPIDVVNEKREFVRDLIFKLKDRVDVDVTS